MVVNQPAKSRGPYAKSVGRRADIARAAMEAFAEHGYERASLRDIAQRAGISHSTLLHHFANKEELLRAALEQREAEDRARATAAAAAGASTVEVLSEQLSVELGSPETARAWQVLRVAATDPAHPAHAYFRERQERLRTQMVQGLLARRADTTRAEAEAVATAFQALLAGLPILVMTDANVDVHSALALFLDMVGLSSSSVPAQPSAAHVG